jgi:pimeloyl-ACP methyl ester carboxylesterase/DNA-binding CsgD family transcriptional regulator
MHGTRPPPPKLTGDAVVDAWIADPDRASAAAQNDQSELAIAIDDGRAPQPLLSRSMLALAIVQSDGARVWADRHFDQWVDASAIDAGIIASARRPGGGRSVATTDQHDQPLMLVYLPSQDAGSLLGERRIEAGQVVIAAISLAHDSDLLIEAGRSFGMSDREAEVAAALVRYGGLQRAAGACGVTYSAARNAIASALRKAGAARQSELVSLLVRHAGYIPADRDGAEQALRDIFGLSARDARLALLLSEGHTRGEAAAAAGLSEAVAKDAFERVFTALGVTAAPQVSRVIAEAFTASLLAQAALSDSWRPDMRGEPLRIISRAKSGRIAVSDFGPLGARPVIIIHSSATTRHPARSFVAKLQAAGYRPLAIDRPGFGMSDMHDAPSDPFEDAAHDMAEMCAAFRFDRVDLVARGGAHAALAFARLYPALCGRVVAINPDTAINAESKREGLLGAAKNAFWRHPEATEKLARIAASQVTSRKLSQLMRASMRASPSDLAIFEDERELSDYGRAVMLFATGRISGMIAEQRAYAFNLNDPPLIDARNWRILIGAQDPLNHAADMETYWRARLPGATFDTIADAGRFIHLSHAARVIAALS